MKLFIIWLTIAVALSVGIFFMIFIVGGYANDKDNLINYELTGVLVVLSVFVGLDMAAKRRKDDGRSWVKVIGVFLGYTLVASMLCATGGLLLVPLLINAPWSISVLLPLVFGIMFIRISFHAGILDPKLESKLFELFFKPGLESDRGNGGGRFIGSASSGL